MFNWIIRLLFGEPRKSLEELFNSKLYYDLTRIEPNYIQIFRKDIKGNYKLEVNPKKIYHGK